MQYSFALQTSIRLQYVTIILPGLHFSPNLFIAGDKTLLQGVQTLRDSDGITLGLNIGKELGSIYGSFDGTELGSSVASSERYTDGKLDGLLDGVSLE